MGGKAEGGSGRADKRVESSGREWRGSNRLDSCCLLFREIPTSAVPPVVYGEAQPGVFEVLLCYYMDGAHLYYYYTFNAPFLKTAPVLQTATNLGWAHPALQSGKSCDSLRDSQQHHWSTTQHFCYSKCLPYHWRDADLVPKHLLHKRWSMFFYCGFHCYIADNLIYISEYVNCQLLQEETCNMKISCHVGVKPSIALTLQLPCVHVVCVCVCACACPCVTHVYYSVFIQQEQSPCKTK